MIGTNVLNAMKFFSPSLYLPPLSLQILHKRLSTENVVISHGFYLKLTGVDFDPPAVHHGISVNRLKRTASVSDRITHTIAHFALKAWKLRSLGA